LSRTSQLAIPLASLPSEALSIGALERETGLSKDTLRIWERRYAFPQPIRDANGERTYPTDQIEKLRLIKRLIDRGLRPGKIIALDLHALETLSMQTATRKHERPDLDLFLEILRSHDLFELRRQLAQTLMLQGLHRFVLDTVAPLNDKIADSWMRGELESFEEQFYAEQMRGVLRSAIHSIQHEGRVPRVLLTTFPGEGQALGLLMVEAVLSVAGAVCVPLGMHMSCREIARAATAYDVDIAGLVFGASLNEKSTATGLSELRLLLPRGMEVWASGGISGRLRKPTEGVCLAPTVEKVPQLLRDWRNRHGA